MSERERNHPQILEHDLDFLIRGNLNTFTIGGWRRLGNMLTKFKKQFEAGEHYGIIPGRPLGTTTQQGNEKALEMYKIYLKVRQAYKGKKRKSRSTRRSHWTSIYDEVAFSYESIHRLQSGTISGSQAKYLVGKGKKICEYSEANKSQGNSAELT